ncbi:ATP-binding protein [Micromonospora azadirachtae]|uniref:ATP-binding protein n=1 Tax=Micromonospora azadirachtae TaxID=1970735 RepID=A0ABW2ZVH3_9ACTN
MTNTLTPWLSIAKPRTDIADGSFDESLFAADLGLVAEGLGPKDYLDPYTFCEKTYLTGNLRAVLTELGSRLAGDDSAAGVYRLQTEFGGGKTHTLLSAFHIFGTPEKVTGTDLGRQLASLLPGNRIPKAKVVVLDGSALKVAPVATEDGCHLTSLLGHLAYRLGGKPAWDGVADADQKLLGSSTIELQALLAEHSPCLILIDETLEYLNKALAVAAGDGNLAGVTLTFIKELVTAAANTRGVAVLATLTSSRAEDYATVSGLEMQDRLSRVVGRTENIVTPVEGDDIFPILHRRLFTTVGTPEQRREVADAYCDWYQSLADALPSGYSEQAYRDRIAAAYPFHPELVDILTNRWGSLSGFQRTRGALRTLAHCVKALSQARSKSALIHPGDMPLADAGVRAEILRFAGDSYKAALNADIIRPDSKAQEEDARRGGQVKDAMLATGLATTAFLDSFGPDKVLGASAVHMLLGVGRPGMSRGLIEDVRDTLEGLLWYMRLEGGRYRFTTEPNLNKVVLEREAAIEDRRIEQVLRDTIKKVAPETDEFRVRPWVHDSNDLPDEPRLTLGVLDFEHRINGETTPTTLALARQILENRGSVFRSNKNSAVLVVADSYALTKARASARTLLALQDVQSDQVRLKRFNAEQRDQLTKRLAGTQDRLPHQTVMAYRHLVLLGESAGQVALDRIDLGPAGADATITSQVTSYLTGADRLIGKLSPAALLSDRFGLLPDGTDTVELDRLAGYFATLVRLPKLSSRKVLQAALAEGCARRVFGLVSGSAPDAPDSVVRFGDKIDDSEIQFQPGTWLVRGTVAADLRNRSSEAAAGIGTSSDGDTGGTGSTDGTTTGTGTAATGTGSIGGSGGGTSATGGATSTGSTKKRVSAVRLTLDGIAADQVRDVLRSAINPLAAVGASLEVDIEIRADGPATGIPREVLELTVLEGLRQSGIDAKVDTTES